MSYRKERNPCELSMYTLCEVASVIKNTICVGLEGKELQYHYDFKRLG